VQLDWDEQSKVLRVGGTSTRRGYRLTTQDVANFLNTSCAGLAATSYRRASSPSTWCRVATPSSGTSCRWWPSCRSRPAPASRCRWAQVASIRYAFEQGLVWRRNREPAITVRGQIHDTRIQAPTVTAEIAPRLEPIRAKLPAGYRIETGGAVEESAKGRTR
jgi:multidrug efflux pump